MNTMADTMYGSAVEAALSQMGAIARAEGPTHFVSDLLRDGAWVAMNPGKPFYWIVQDDGTHIAWEWPTVEMVVRAMGVDTCKIYFFDGETLHSNVDGPCYWTVVIPFSERPTEWHPTESTGPFAVLTRGSFPSPDVARAWAESHLNAQPYSVRFIESE